MMKLVISFTVLLFSIFNSAHGAENYTNQNVMKDSLKNGGIIFFATENLEEVTSFYIERVKCTLWLDQGACRILQHGNLLFGFCKSDHVDKEGVITFFYPEKEIVDQMYRELKSLAVNPPKVNPKFHIYHFYARDPEGRSIEFQYFDHELKPY